MSFKYKYFITVGSSCFPFQHRLLNVAKENAVQKHTNSYSPVVSWAIL